MEGGYIPANLHYNTPNPNIPALLDGRLRVVSETTKLQQGVVGLSSFGFGGSNVFALLGSTVQPRTQPLRKLAAHHPRQLFTCSWRTEEGLNNILDAAVENSTNVDYLNLLQMTSQLSTCHHPHRGYAVLNSENEYRGSQVSISYQSRGGSGMSNSALSNIDLFKFSIIFLFISNIIFNFYLLIVH